MLIGAGLGAVTNRDDPLKGALMGGATGAIGGGIAGHLAKGATGAGTSAAGAAAQEAGVASISQAGEQAVAQGAMGINPVVSGSYMAPSGATITPAIEPAGFSQISAIPEGVSASEVAAEQAVMADMAPLQEEALNPSMMQRLGQNFKNNIKPEALKANFQENMKGSLGKQMAMQAAGPQEQQQAPVVMPQQQQFTPFSPVQRQRFIARQQPRRAGSRRFT
jgi:hypothetical protein